MRLRALHDQLISLDYIQYLHPSIRIVRHDIREPMTAGLDELVLMQAGSAPPANRLPRRSSPLG